MSNRDRVGRALELLGVALGRYVDERMARRSLAGGNWKGTYPNENVDSDPATLIGVILDNWSNVFRDELQGDARSLLGLAKGSRNKWAHNEPFSDRATERALDTVEWLLALIRAPEAAEVGRLKRSPAAPSPPPPAPRPRTPMRRDPRRTDDGHMPGGEQNCRLIVAAARALTAAGQTPFTRIRVYEWIWARYERREHDRPSLDPTFQGMISNAPGGPPSACGTPLFRVGRALYELRDSTDGDLASRVVNAPSRATSGTVGAGHPISEGELASAGFKPLHLRPGSLDVDLPSGPGCEWTTVGEVPEGPGLYAFTVEDDHDIRVTYVGRTEHLWMVTKGRLPSGGGRGGQRYGMPRHAGATRQRVNILVAEQLRAGRLVRHWVRPLPAMELRAEEERLITVWDLRRVGWNRG